MISYALKRLGFALITLFLVLTCTFILLRIIPGDPALVIVGEQGSEAAAAAVRARLGLDQPMHVQYFTFLFQILSGEFGNSMISNRPVIGEIAAVLPWTLELTAASLVLGLVLGVPAGVWSAVRRNKVPDYLMRVISLIGLSAPAFVIAIVLMMVFAIQFKWFPVISGAGGANLFEHMRNMALPTISLGLIMMAYVTRVTRSAMLEVLNQDFVRTARAKGTPSSAVIWRHALGNCLIPITALIGLQLGILIGNSVLTEIVFNRPGLGKLILNALLQRDYTLLQGLVVIYTLLVVVVNLITDLAYGFLDPRVQYK